MSQSPIILEACRLRQNERVLRLLTLARGNRHVYADEGQYLVRMGLRVEQAERRSPRAALEHDLVLVKALFQMIDDLIEVGKRLGDGEAMWVRLRIEGASGTALIPIDHDEMVFELAVEIAEQRPLSPARPSMQPEQDGRGPISATCQEVELRTLHRQILRALD